MSADNPDLWQSVRAFELDNPSSALPFSVRLARENGWSLRYAQRVIGEYRRFVYLAAIGHRPVCPSVDVDEAWHLHLCYTRSYWHGLCRGVLKNPLHHDPTAGGERQLAHHQAMYQETLEAYRNAFHREPPQDIWPPVETRFAQPPTTRRIDSASCWIVPKPAIGRWARLALGESASRRAGPRKLVGLALLPVAPTLGATANPFDMKGPQFLAFYLALIAFSFLAGLVMRRLLREDPVGGPLPDLDEFDPYDAAILAAGERHAVQLALAELTLEGIVDIDKDDQRKLRAAAELPADKHPLVRAVYQAIADREDATLGDAYKAALPVAAAAAGELEERGLLPVDGSTFAARCFPMILMGLVLAVGAIKVSIGLTRNKPVAFLVILCAAPVVGGLSFLRPLPRTPRGDRVLAALKNKHAALRSNTEILRQPDQTLLLGMGLFGLTALAGTSGALGELYQWMRPRPTEASKWWNNGTGCGTSGCGTSGCGGSGCGGGGCGGCGGD